MNVAARAVSEGRFLEAARGFLPRIRELAPRMRTERRLDDQLVLDMDRAGIFSLFVPKRWGGPGLGPREAIAEASKIMEVIAAVDCSTAWVASFYMIHNWMLCKYPLQVQEKLFAGRNSVPGAGAFGPPGKAVRVDGGYRVTGRWPYCSGILHGEHLRAAVMVDGAVHWCLIPRKDLEIIDDWHMAAMSATGSVTVAADNVFVPDGWHMELTKVVQPSPQPLHEDIISRLPLFAVAVFANGLSIGALERAVELGREKLLTAMAQGVPRVQIPAARIRWAEAYERARVMRLVNDAITNETLDRALGGEPPSLQSEARMMLHVLHLVQGVKDAARLLVDGLGTSTYRSDNQLYQIAQDLGMLATHALSGDYDIAMDRHARWLLGLGLQAGDPGTRMSDAT